MARPSTEDREPEYWLPKTKGTMKHTTVTCDKCGQDISHREYRGRTWVIGVNESHGACAGTMGYEKAIHYDFCMECGDAIVAIIEKAIGERP